MVQPTVPPSGGERDVDAAQVTSDLRVTSDSLLRMIDRLYELERRKRELQPADPEFVRLAREVEDVAAATLRETSLEVELADDVAERAKTHPDGIVDMPIVDMSPGSRDATLILADWRSAERSLAAAPRDSEAERGARQEVERLRAEYAATIQFHSDPDLGRL
jgi:hypothetical protein